MTEMMTHTSASAGVKSTTTGRLFVPRRVSIYVVACSCDTCRSLEFAARSVRHHGAAQRPVPRVLPVDVRGPADVAMIECH